METILMKLGIIVMVCGIIFFYYFLATFTVNRFWQNINDIKKNIEIRKKINKWKQLIREHHQRKELQKK